METKKCTKCGENKPISEFHKNSASKDGLQYQCKSCQYESAKERSSRPLVKVKPEALAKVDRRPQTDTNNPLSSYTPRELMQELRRRGYEGELTYTCRINISNM